MWDLREEPGMEKELTAVALLWWLMDRTLGHAEHKSKAKSSVTNMPLHTTAQKGHHATNRVASRFHLHKHA